MLEPMTDRDLTAQLMEIGQDPSLRDDLNQLLGDFCHQCRNRLNSLKLAIYLAKRQSPQGVTAAWHDLEAAYQSLENQVEMIHTLCRPLCLSPVTIALNLLFDDRKVSWAATMARVGREVEFQHPTGKSVARFDVDRLGTALDAVVSWRAEQGGTAPKALVRWWVEPERAHVSWSESALEEFAAAPRAPAPEAAWILPILTRVVAEHGGSLRVDDRAGWKLELSWPSQPS